LNKKIALRGDYLMESVISESGEQVGEFELKNVCAKVTSQLSQQIDDCVQVLGVSKRKFLEAAMIEACRKAEDLCEELDLYKLYEQKDSSK
jgi:hypothetical protein